MASIPNSFAAAWARAWQNALSVLVKDWGRGMRAWPTMIWIGGSPGAGKSTVASWLARSHDLPLHPIDAWTYEHARRMPPTPPLDAQLASSAESAAAEFITVSHARLPLILDDVAARRLGDVPAVVEGPQLMPSMSGPLPPGHGVWLVTDPAQTHRARSARTGQAERLGALVRRDAVLTEQIRRTAADADLPIIEVPIDPDWAQVTAAVTKALGPVLDSSLRLEHGPDLSRQRRMENLTVCRQLRLWAADAGLTVPPQFRFACECGHSGCQAGRRATADDYAARTGDNAPLLVDDHVATWRTR